MPPNIGNASTTGKQSEIITLFMCQDASMMERKEEKIKNADWKTLSLRSRLNIAGPKPG